MRELNNADWTLTTASVACLLGGNIGARIAGVHSICFGLDRNIGAGNGSPLP
jgi:hypothetical protein